MPGFDDLIVKRKRSWSPTSSILRFEKKQRRGSRTECAARLAPPEDNLPNPG